jgi:hypothetical protein
MKAVLDGRTELPETPPDTAATVKTAALDFSSEPPHPPTKSEGGTPAASPSVAARPRISWGMLAAIAAICLIVGAALTVLAMKLTMH